MARLERARCSGGEDRSIALQAIDPPSQGHPAQAVRENVPVGL